MRYSNSLAILQETNRFWDRFWEFWDLEELDPDLSRLKRP